MSECLLIITALSLGRFVLKENKNVLYFLFVVNFNSMSLLNGMKAHSFRIPLFSFSCAMMFMQSNAPASCSVIKPLTPQDWIDYEKE